MKCYAQNAETCSKYGRYALNAEMLIHIMLKSRNIPTCSISKLYNMAIRRAQEHTRTTNNFPSIVLYD